MSWIIASLLNSREEIRANADIDSQEFNDLLAIEKAIKELLESNLVKESELRLIGIGEPVAEEIPHNRHTLSNRKKQVYDRIAYYLGGYFTDDGYLNYIKKKYNLSSEQVEILREYIVSNRKNVTLRKPLISSRKRHESTI